MVDAAGNVVGEHIGLAFYTIGQRKGIGIGGRSSTPGEPWYVAGKDAATNTLTVVQGHDHPLLMKRSLRAGEGSWVSGKAPKAPSAHTAKTRYRQADAPCVLSRVLEGELQVDFAAPQRAVTPGQSVVLYDAEVCLGGGIIS
jgi:tRNA-specific 2-thiouridylase